MIGSIPWSLMTSIVFRTVRATNARPNEYHRKDDRPDDATLR